jgi:hypothetical protein
MSPNCRHGPLFSVSGQAAQAFRPRCSNQRVRDVMSDMRRINKRDEDVDVE